MKIFKNKNVLLILVSTTIIISFLLFWYFKPQKRSFFIFPNKINQKIQLPEKKITLIKQIQYKTQGPAYDYNNMINLLSKYRKIEMLFNAHFETFTKNSQNFDLLKTMLHNFKIEKESFTKYMKRIKAYYKKAFPNRKKNNLRYYQRIIEEDIDELEEMIEKFDIQNEKISKN